MKLNIFVIEGAGGTGKTTFIKDFKDKLIAQGITPVLLKFPLGTDESVFAKSMILSVKENLQEETRKAPLRTGIRMLNEQCETIVKTYNVYKQQGCEHLVLLIDRAWVSTSVYQDIPAHWAAGFVDEGLAPIGSDLNWDKIRVFVLEASPELVISRKIARIAADSPDKLNQEFVYNLMAKTKTDLEKFKKMTEDYYKNTIIPTLDLQREQYLSIMDYEIKALKQEV